MSLYIIEDDNGNVMDSYGDFDNSMINAMLYDELHEPESYVKEFGGHVVKLAEKQKVKLPREVGEELEDWLKTDSVDTIITDLVCVSEGDHQAVRDWWNSTLDATYLIADIARYGWEAEPEAKWYVKAPESWKADGGGLNWLYITSRGGVDVCSHTGESDEQFTRSELKLYHLDSDIFTLVPVEDEK